MAERSLTTRGVGASSNSSSAQAEQQQKLQSVQSYVQRIRQGDTAKWDKDELLNVIYWWRQVAGVLIGLLLGFGRVTGFYGVMMFFMTNISTTLALLKTVLGIDEEEFGGFMEFLFEGMFGSFASFMVSWILTYTALQQQQ